MAPVFTHVQVAVPLTATVSTAVLVVPFLSLWKKMLPTVMAIVLGGGGGGPEVAVALKVTGEPVAPVTAACADWAPAVGPSVQLLAAMPSPPVGPDVGARVPVPVDQFTVTPDWGAPSRVTMILRSFGSASLTGPVCASPLAVGSLATTSGDGLGVESPPPHPPTSAATTPSASAVFPQAPACALLRMASFDRGDPPVHPEPSFLHGTVLPVLNGRSGFVRAEPDLQL